LEVVRVDSMNLVRTDFGGPVRSRLLLELLLVDERALGVTAILFAGAEALSALTYRVKCGALSAPTTIAPRV
jgi:hypothetical protein